MSPMADIKVVDNLDQVKSTDAVTDAGAVVARGYYNAGDGGGGLFVWHPESAAKEDQGTILASKPSGRWYRVYSGALNVRWFGAWGNTGPRPRQAPHDDISAFEWAINASTDTDREGYQSYGAEIFVPEGEYKARLELPRLGGAGRGLTIRGAGIRTSRIIWNEEDQAVVGFRPDLTEAGLRKDCRNYRFLSIQFRHTKDGGMAFYHPWAPDLVHGRLDKAVFEDVAFRSTGVADEGSAGYTRHVAEIRSLHNSRLVNVEISGSAGLCVSGGRNHLLDVHTDGDYEQTQGIVLHRCGESAIDRPRIDGIAGTHGGGIVVWDSDHVSIRNTSFEGKGGRCCVRIHNSWNITLDNCNMGGSAADQNQNRDAKYAWAALWIDSCSEDIRIEGGRINVYGWTGIRVERSCRSVRGRGIVFPGSTQAALMPPTPLDPNHPDADVAFLVVDPSAADIRIQVLPELRRPRQQPPIPRWAVDALHPGSAPHVWPYFNAEDPPAPLPSVPETRAEFAQTVPPATLPSSGPDPPPDAPVEHRRFRPDAPVRRVCLLLGRWEGLRVSAAGLQAATSRTSTGNWVVADIAQGGHDEVSAPAAAGRRVTLFIQNSRPERVTVASNDSSIRLANGDDWTPGEDGVLELVSDGALWWEVGRFLR
jgi:hypothetical protein